MKKILLSAVALIIGITAEAQNLTYSFSGKYSTINNILVTSGVGLSDGNGVFTIDMAVENVIGRLYPGVGITAQANVYKDIVAIMSFHALCGKYSVVDPELPQSSSVMKEKVQLAPSVGVGYNFGSFSVFATYDVQTYNGKKVWFLNTKSAYQSSFSIKIVANIVI